jgi:hypothetical protein
MGRPWRGNVSDTGQAKAVSVKVAVLALALAAIIASAVLQACVMVDEGYSYWMLNDSDSPVLVNIHEALHRTWVVPPHTFGGLFSGLGRPAKGWTITFVDERCQPLQTFAVDAADNLVYVDPAGRGSLADDHAWSHGLASATQATLVERSPVCP